jgi:hypothetical protein
MKTTFVEYVFHIPGFRQYRPSGEFSIIFYDCADLAINDGQ